MTEQQPPVEEPEESGSLPPDYDAPGQVDYPDPAFEDEADEVDVETPDDGEPEADGGESEAGDGAPDERDE
jgi:hypothetical protein